MDRVTLVAARRPSAGILTGLVGNGIGTSRSPALHQGEADALGIRLVYSLFDLPDSGEGRRLVPEVLRAAQLLGFAGVNVTHPFKQEVMVSLDDLSDEARRIGAVNTIAFSGGRTTGYNTDYLGYAESLKRGLPEERFDEVIQLGTGGAGAATAYALLQHGTRVLHLHDIQRERAEALAAHLSGFFGSGRVRAVDDLQATVARVDGLVNATPVGMDGHEGMPVPAEWLRAEMWVSDIIYFPLETELLRQAAARGCRTLNGVRMVVFQAAAAFDIFTGLEADRERMLQRAMTDWR